MHTKLAALLAPTLASMSFAVSGGPPEPLTIEVPAYPSNRRARRAEAALARRRAKPGKHRR